MPRPRRCKAGGLGGAWECNQSPTNEEMWHYDGNGCLKTPTWDEDCDGNPVEISGFATKRACMEICALCDIYGHSCDWAIKNVPYAKRMQSATLKCKNNNKHHHTWTKAKQINLQSLKEAAAGYASDCKEFGPKHNYHWIGPFWEVIPPPTIGGLCVKSQKVRIWKSEFESLMVESLMVAGCAGQEGRGRRVGGPRWSC